MPSLMADCWTQYHVVYVHTYVGYKCENEIYNNLLEITFN